MNEKLKNLRDYCLDRLNEASTWRGIVLMAASAGASLSADLRELIIMVGVGVAGAIGAMFPDKRP